MVEQQTTTGTMKVYELAKELGVDSISLLDKLATLNIKVKNHMSDLAGDDLRIARESLGKKDEKKAAAKKTTVTRKKKSDAVEEAAATTAPAASATTLKKRATATKTAAAAPAAPEAPVAKSAAPAGSAIIRRRKTGEEGEIASTVVGAPKKETSAPETPAHAEETASTFESAPVAAARCADAGRSPSRGEAWCAPEPVW